MAGAGSSREPGAPESESTAPEHEVPEPEPESSESTAPEPESSESTAPGRPGYGDVRPWRALDVGLLVVGLVAGLAIRAVLLPTDGFRPDIDQFVLWVHGLATGPFGEAYDQDLTFGPVMAGIWGLLAAIEPAFRTAVDAADPAIRALMKAPASLADVGIAVSVAWVLRARPGWAVVAGLAILLHPVVVDVSAWWGQYESIFVLLGVLAFIAAISGHPYLAAALVAASLMTKPQALPFLVPFGAWFLATGGWRRAIVAAGVGVVTCAVLWLPFVAAGGPLAYLGNLDAYQTNIFAVLSLRAWNPWWLLQEAVAGGQFVADTTAIVGPFTPRHLGYAAAAVLELVVLLAVYRRPTPKVLALGLAASTFATFLGLTTMHERYAYAALVFLALALPDRRVAWTFLAFGLVYFLNLVWAIPPAPWFESAIASQAVLGWLGPIATIALGGVVFWLLLDESGADDRAVAPATAVGDAAAA